MTVVLETTIKRFIGDTADSKPTGVPAGSTFLDRQTSILYVTYDGTNWVAKSTIAKLGANSGVDIGDVDVTSVVPGTAATSLGKAEDGQHASGDTGVMLLAVRKDVAAALAGADADYIPLIVDASGRLHVAPLVAGSAIIGKVGIDKTLTIYNATGAGAIALSSTMAAQFRLLSVTVHFDAAPTTPEDLTVTLNANDGAAYDTVLLRTDPSSGAVTDIVYLPEGQGMICEAGDEIDVAYTNTDANTYGVRIVVEAI